MKPELYKIYKEKVVPALKTELALDNIMRVPKIEKVVINVGYGRNTKDKAFIERVERTLTLISGQRPIHNKAKKSISNFKIREGMEIGVSVTLRGAKMYEFLYKLINLTFPRVRDFRGIDLKSFDGKGNYTIGFKEQLAFPEISGESADNTHGLQLIINTTAGNDKAGYALLSQIGFPFRKK
ncbi:MAG: 50S ribosomal protein L5 [uncultured bacterium]|nr:MAG: 50S ribosomal protein L5 [uncultured bacterium]MDD2656502.1 50S ribosomal protein L5 [Patescibacteria group bacterium]OGH84813.1 MAG: 50S ribosomal protein L5 [Candidatus Magasanikbacteria bacterium RIFOXYC12_FULL_32_21b]OGH91616.1 MAG: 50S ribosomal protein L5 [Candidatus Magasanikbacteria bacterium RIFOXYD12_FULL_33_17]HAO52494.1 50S ribosomal protein L5 [Candidatus Magasanikbacteria bacterium]